MLDFKRIFCYNNSMDTQTKPIQKDLFVEFLHASGVVPDVVLASLTERSEGQPGMLEQFLVQEGYMTEAQLGLAKAQIRGWHAIDLRKQPPLIDVADMLPRSFAEAKHVLPFAQTKDVIDIATSNPEDDATVRLLEKKFGGGVRVFYATDAMLHDAINRQYDTETKEQLRLALTPDALKNEDNVVRLVDALLLHAARQHASDIHIEPAQDEVVVRERVDGLLRHVTTFGKDVHERITQRIKVLANLATDEHAQPQDGKFTIRDLDGKRADVRVSIVPTSHGEDMVMRLLIAEHQVMPLESLGFDERQRKIMDAEMNKAWGMILVTGPTGSGKTTTLYATILKIQREEISISSIEDPIEYDLPRTNQIQVHEKIGVTFAAGLRSLVRHDPNVILVGEIRDPETASMAVNASMTGHLVLSTLHTNDAATAVPRLLDMGLEPFLLSSTINVIVAQRLVRTICDRCRESVEVTEADLHKLLPKDVAAMLLDGKKSMHLFHGKGCDLCHKSGFRGRKGIFELLRMSDAIRSMIMKNEDADSIRKKAMSEGMIPMMHDGMKKVKEGMTTIEEVLRVIRT